MNILFDFEIEDYPLRGELSNRAEFIIYEIRTFILQRFHVLESEMNKEESENGAFVVLRTLDPPFAIGYHKYSTALKEKMNNSLTPEDWVYMAHKITEGLPFFGE